MILVNLFGGAFAGAIIAFVAWGALFLLISFMKWDLTLTDISLELMRFSIGLGVMIGFCGAAMEMINQSNDGSHGE